MRLIQSPGTKTCIRCQKRKAKRRCPALGGGICQLCCGLLRDKKLRCPDSCPHFGSHQTYQEERSLHRGTSDFQVRSDDERLNWLSLHVEAPLKEIGEQRPSFTDRDALLALEYAREKIERGSGRLILPGQPGVRGREAGEMVLQSVESCRFERPIVIAGTPGTYTSEEKQKILQAVILSVKRQSRGRPDGRAYIDDLIERFSRIQKSAKPKKLIVPSA